MITLVIFSQLAKYFQIKQLTICICGKPLNRHFHKQCRPLCGISSGSTRFAMVKKDLQTFFFENYDTLRYNLQFYAEIFCLSKPVIFTRNNQTVKQIHFV